MAHAYPPRPRMSCACCAVIRTRLSRSDMFAVNCASWAWRWEIWRGFCEGIMLRRDDAFVCERGGFVITFALQSEAGGSVIALEESGGSHCCMCTVVGWTLRGFGASSNLQSWAWQTPRLSLQFPPPRTYFCNLSLDARLHQSIASRKQLQCLRHKMCAVGL